MNSLHETHKHDSKPPPQTQHTLHPKKGRQKKPKP